MACFKPLQAFKKQGGGVAFGRGAGVFIDLPIEIPCGQCIGCRIERARQWSVRCTHEMQLHDENCFLTLTYDNWNIPLNGSLRPRDMTLFLKRFREYIKRAPRPKGTRPYQISYIQCGEYGEKLSRPHHHAIIFGYMFKDLRGAGKSASGEAIFTSATLDGLWRQGACKIGKATQKSANYIAQYTTKKIYGDAAAAHYGDKLPEYLTMSRNPAIGLRWINQYHDQTYRHDEVVNNGRTSKVPAYYDRIYKRNEREAHDALKLKRKRKIKTKEQIYNSSPERLAVREEVLDRKLKTFKRDYNNEN